MDLMNYDIGGLAPALRPRLNRVAGKGAVYE
jgi:hypothetical protein